MYNFLKNRGLDLDDAHVLIFSPLTISFSVSVILLVGRDDLTDLFLSNILRFSDLQQCYAGFMESGVVISSYANRYDVCLTL